MSICCKAIRQIYYNAGSGYTVASYMTNEDLPEEVKKQKNGNYGIFQAFGTELPTNEGLDVELTGDWKPTKYGMQYSVSDFSVTMPTTKEGIRTYLSSSLIKGIGPAMAARIVETFGEDTLNVFNDSPEKLLQVKGITQKRLDDILEGYQKSSSIRELMMYLSPFGVTPAKASKIQEKFGSAAVMIVKEEPFRLCEVHGFGFLTVDQIAVKAKHFRADDPLRIKAAILHIMSEAEGEGHLYLKREDIIERVEKLLNHNKDVSPVSERAIRDTGNDMIHTDGSLVCHDGGFYTRKSFQAELGAAAALVRLHMQTGMAVNVDRILRKIQKEQDIILNAKQQVAVKNVFENPVSIITGGPGRGKTTVIRFIIAVQEALDIPPSLQPVPLTPEEQEELRKKEERKDRLHQNYLKRKASGAQKRYEDKIKTKKKAAMDAKKALIRAENMKKGVFSTVGQLPKEEPRKGSIAASAAV